MTQPHEYADLQLGFVQQYCMAVPRWQQEQWRAAGWLSYQDIGIPFHTVYSPSLLYGWVGFSRILMFTRPAMLAEQPPIGRRVCGFSTELGTYGMGGAGFFGLLLDNQEYLVYTAWVSGQFVLLDGRAIEQHPSLPETPRPWLHSQDTQGKELAAQLQGCLIADCVLSDSACRLTLHKNGREHLLEYLCRDNRLNTPDFSREDRPQRAAFEEGVMADYLLYQHENGRLIV